MPPNPALLRAFQLHQSNQLAQAEQLYRQILQSQPDDPDALQLLGALLTQARQYPEAVALLQKSIQLKPNSPQAHYNLGNALRDAGQSQAAVDAFTRAIGLQPNYPKAFNNLGSLLADLGQPEAAVGCFQKALALQPQNAEVLVNLSAALADLGKTDEAIAACKQAIAIRPSSPQAKNALGNALAEKGLFREAADAYRQALALKPAYAKALSNLSNALREMGELDQAVEVAKQAVTLAPDFPEARSNLGNALSDLARFDEALAAFEQAIALKPNYAKFHSNLASALLAKGDLDAALGQYERAVALNPGHHEGHKNYGLALLLAGRFEEGWREHEHRWQCKDFVPFRRNFEEPQWSGEPIAGQTLLLHAEQGFGDTVQFIRYLPMIQQRAGQDARIIVECQADLVRLLQFSFPQTAFIARGQPLPAFDVHLPMLSLPFVFNTTLDSIPRATPYLMPDPGDVDRWKSRTQDPGSGRQDLKVGLAWAGNPAHKNDRNRSIPLALLAPLGAIPNARFFSLQKLLPANAPQTPPPFEIIDLTRELKDFADTAALIANLDVVISVDTVIAHLSGALARPTHLLLPNSSDWRWLTSRSDTPWYPTLTLHRQPAPREWTAVLASVVQMLKH